MSSRRASASSSLRVGSSPRRTAAASCPSAVRVRLFRCLRVCLLLAPACAFLTFCRAAARCLAVATGILLPLVRVLGILGEGAKAARHLGVRPAEAVAVAGVLLLRL